MRMKDLIKKNGYKARIAPKKLKFKVTAKAIKEARRLDSKNCAVANALVELRDGRGRRVIDQVRVGRKHVWARRVNSDFFDAYVMEPSLRKAVQLFDRKGKAAMSPGDAVLLPMPKCDFGRKNGGRIRDEGRVYHGKTKKRTSAERKASKTLAEGKLANRNMVKWNII